MSDPLKEGQVLELLQGVQWDRIAMRLSMPLEYGGFTSDALLRIHLLPYLLPIRSERQLAFAVAEKDALRHAVGMTGSNTPLRGTLWHFRKRNLQLFRKLLVRGLSVIYLDALDRDLSVPFLGSDYCLEGDADWRDHFHDKISDTRVDIACLSQSRLASREEQLVLPLSIQSGSANVTPRLLLPHDVGFPVQVTFVRPQRSPDRQCIVFRQPSWMNEPYGRFEVGDYISRTNEPYTACNIIVKRRFEGRDQILLSKRLQGAGQGSYTLPGGKKRADESARTCVKRELKEETGLVPVNSRPISIRYTRRTGYPRVRSIGVLVEEVHGLPQRRERHQHSEWNWYDLANLPAPLFFPTKAAIDDFRSNKSPNLTWEDVEDSVDLPLWEKGV